MKIFVTGAAGFIGFNVASRLARSDDTVAGIDNVNDYRDVGLKEARLKLPGLEKGFTFKNISFEDRATVAGLFEGESSTAS